MDLMKISISRKNTKYLKKNDMIENIISDTGNESLQEIIEKILSPEDLNKKFMVYSMFKITRGRDPILIKNINLWLQL